MSKGLASYPEDQRMRVAERRLKDERALRGNGFWAAKAFYDKKKMRYPGKMGQAEEARIKVALAMKGYKVNEDGSFHMSDEPRNGGKLPRKNPGFKNKFADHKQNKNFKPHQNRMRVVR